MDERYELDVLVSSQTNQATDVSLEEDHPSTSNVPLLTSTCDEAVTLSRPLSTTQERKRIGWQLLLATFAIVALSAGCAGVLLLWVTVIRGVRPIAGKSLLLGALEHGAFLADEGTTTDQNSPQTATLLLLSFSSVTTQLVSMTAPLLVMMAAYCLAGIWIAEQERPSSGAGNLPTPAQFGFLVKLSSSAGLVSMYQTARYLISGTRPKRRAPAPALLYTAIISIAAIYAVTHLMRYVYSGLNVRAADGKETTSLKLGQSLLTDSLTLVGLALPNTLHGVDEGSESLLKDPIEMFGEASEERGDVEGEDGVGIGREPPRLMLDIVDEGPKKGMIFGVRESKPRD